MSSESQEQIEDRDFITEFTEFVEKYSKDVEEIRQKYNEGLITSAKLRKVAQKDNTRKLDKKNSQELYNDANKVYKSMMKERSEDIFPLRKQTEEDFFVQDFIIGGHHESLYKINTIEKLKFFENMDITSITNVFESIVQYEYFGNIMHDTDGEKYTWLLSKDSFAGLKREYDKSTDKNEKLRIGKELFTLQESLQDEWHLEQEIKKPRKESSFDYKIDRINALKGLIIIPSEEVIKNSKISISITKSEGVKGSNIAPIGEMAPTHKQIYIINDGDYAVYFTSLNDNHGNLGWYDKNSNNICINIHQCKKQYKLMQDIGISGLGSEEDFTKAIILQERSHYHFKATESESEIPSLEAGGLSYLSFRMIQYLQGYIYGIPLERPGYEEMTRIYINTLEKFINNTAESKRKVESAKQIMLNTKTKRGSIEWLIEMRKEFFFVFTQDFANRFIPLYKEEVKNIAERYKK